MTLHELLDLHYCADGDATLRRMLAEGADPDLRHGPRAETPLHVATRRRRSTAVDILLTHGADLNARGLDAGTPLHQAAWFGQPANARLLIAAGAPLDVFDDDHGSSPLHWAVHGSRFSGGAEERQDAYVELVEMLLAAGSSLHYPGYPHGDAYKKRLLEHATARVRDVLHREFA